MPISLNLENYTIKEGSGKNTIKDVHGLCDMCSIPQLNRFADNYLDRRFKKGTKKLEACELLFTAFQKTLSEGTSVDDKKFEGDSSTGVRTTTRPDTSAKDTRPGTGVSTNDGPTETNIPELSKSSKKKTTLLTVPGGSGSGRLVENKSGLQLIAAVEMIASLLGEKIRVSKDGTFNGLITICCTNNKVKVNGQFFPGGEKGQVRNI